MSAHCNIDKVNRLKQTTSKLIINSLLFIALSSIITPALSTMSVGAASSPSYKYYNSGADIGATGGQFGNNTVKISQNPAGSNTYTGVTQVTVTYNDSWWGWVPLLNIGQETVTCKAGIQINVNSDKVTGSISTPANLNKPEQIISSPDATVITNCSAAQAAHITDFNQSSISISGSTSNTAPIANLAENDDTRQLSVTVYSNKPASELPSGITATLSRFDSDIATENLTFKDSTLAISNQAFFKKIDPATYKVCLTPSSIFNFDQCQEVTKVYGVIPSVTFGSWETISNKEGKLVEVTVNIQTSNSNKDGSYGPLSIVLSSVDNSGTLSQVSTAQTDTKTMNNVSGGANINIVANFDSVEPSNYRVCIASTSFCSDFTKAINMKSSVKITVPSDKSDQFYISKNATTGTCAIDGIGWIVCPVVKFLSSIADSAFTFLSDSFLSTNPKIFDTNSPTYNAWMIMRNLANVAFVIAFLIIIFSQLTGAGITNYGVKKLLPRIVVAAILVNLSYFICQIAVDLSNILGYSLKNLLAGLTPAAGGGTAGFWSGGTWSSIAGGILAGAVGIGVVWASLASLIPVLLAAVVALVMILFILIARQALIILLIVISPLAFVAFLLPNTDQWFKKWQQTFTAMLMLFPIIALVYGVSSLASNVLSQTFSSGGTSLQETLGQIAAAAVMVLPLFAVPTLLKKSLDGVGNIGATLNGLSNKMGGALGARGSKAYDNSRLAQIKKYRAGESDKRRALIQSGAYKGRGGIFNPRNLNSRLSKKFNESKLSGQFGDRKTAQGATIVDAENAELKKSAGSRLDNMALGGKPLSQSQMMQVATGKDVDYIDENGISNKISARTFDTHTRRAAIERASAIATVSDAHKLVDASSSMDVGERITLKNALAGSKVLNKAAYLGGETLGDIEQGTASVDKAVLNNIRKGKINAQVLSNTDKDSARKIFEVAEANKTTLSSVNTGNVDINGNPILVDAIKTLKDEQAKVFAPGSRLQESVAAGTEHDAYLKKLGSL